MATIEFAFPGKDLAEQAQLSQELRTELRAEGVHGEALTVKRERGDTMDLGSVLQLTAGVTGAVATGLNIVAIGHCIYELCFKSRSGLRVKTPNGVFEFGPGEIDVDGLKQVLMDAFDAKRSG
jgi:hypothetical protein